MKKTVIAAWMVLSVLTLCAQDEQSEGKKGFQKENLFVGGNFGLSLGNYTLINVSPQLGYRFSKLVAAGIGVNAQYVSVKEEYNNQPYWKTAQGVAGLNIFGRLYPLEQVMIQVQPELNYIFGKQIFYGPPREEYKLDAEIAPSLLVGGGLVLPSGRGSFIAAVFYDVLQGNVYNGSVYTWLTSGNTNFEIGFLIDRLSATMMVGGILEFAGGVLFILGLLTRPAAFLLSGLMAVAYFGWHAPGGFLPIVNKGELAVLYCFVFLYFVFAGGGAWSLDNLLFGKNRTENV